MSEVETPTRDVITGERRRWYVHLGLLVTLAGALASLITLSHSITAHVVIGVSFMALMLCHLYQRRRTVRSLLTQLVTRHGRARRLRRLAVSDLILEFLVANVLLSGIVDALNHHAAYLPLVGSLGLPPGLTRWHQLSSLVLVVYAIVHFSRRWGRLRRSHIR